MQLPKDGSHYLFFVRYGRYVARRLRRAGRAQLATDVLATVTATKTAGRAWDDADDAVQDAFADRDAADDGLDDAAKTARAALAGRGTTAATEEPYTLVFPEGIDFYVAAPVGEEVQRYQLFVERLSEHLPKGDEVRKVTAKAVQSGVKDYEAAVASLAAAQNAERKAHDQLARALSHLARQLEKVYGLLVAEQGRGAAERFFPRTRTARAAAPTPADPSKSGPAGG